MSNDRSAPLAARVLGFSGLIPFWALALAPLFGVNPPWVQQALMAYAAVILSFVGALHWGVAATVRPQRPWRVFGWSVIPALLAWVALLLPFRDALMLLTLGFATAMLVDQRLYVDSAAAPWLVPMRTVITVLVLVALFVAQLSA